MPSPTPEEKVDQPDYIEEARIQLLRAKQEPIQAEKQKHREYGQLYASIAAAEELRAIRRELVAITTPQMGRGVGSNAKAVVVVNG